MSKTISVAEVANHNTAESAWIIIDSVVYDVTKFARMHPGGEKLLLEYAGTDATNDFYAFHKQQVLRKYARFAIGTIENKKPQIIQQVPGLISTVPYGEPNHLQGFYSPYYNESHIAYRKNVRRIYEEIMQEYGFVGVAGDPNPKLSLEAYRKLGKAGMLAAALGPGKHLDAFPQPGVPNGKFDYFHELIQQEEGALAAFKASGYEKSIGGGFVISVPPIINFGTPATQKYLPALLSGEKTCVLAISEPFAGSDVAQIRCTATKTPDGKFYKVNGVKKWITGAPWADFFSTAVRTGTKGNAGDISMLLIARGPGVETKQIKTSDGTGTALIIFEDVLVPVENLLGKEGHGFQVIMYNFNHERWAMIVGTVSTSRLVVEECFKWAHQRKVFGKKLIEQPVIRNKLANMISEVECIFSWLEVLTYQMNNMSYKEMSQKLAGPIALGKLRSTRVAHHIADEACQIFGGRGITKTGMGNIVEKAILGGSEEILADLGVRQASKSFPRAVL